MMTPEARSFLEQSADCRVWVNLILGNPIPLDWLIKFIKTSSCITDYIMLASRVIASVTAPRNSQIIALRENLKHGQKIGAIAYLLGPLVTVNLITDARNLLERQVHNLSIR